MKLCDLSVGHRAYISSSSAIGLLNERLMSLGFFHGNVIEAIKKSKNNGLSIYEISNTLIALRSEESRMFEVDMI
jgi:Fe2+ transport system protein FeoA